MSKVNMVSHSDSNDVDEAQEFREIYRNANPRMRRLLLKTCRSISDDSQFRKHVRSYSPGFRLMELPTELRIQIAEYVLSSNVTHEWRWTGRQPGKKVGTFKYLHALTTLSRVSRKLHAETAFLGWKLNPFVFKECLLGEDYEEVPSLDDPFRNKKVVPNAFDAYSFFKAKVSLKTLESIGVIILQVKGLALPHQQRHCKQVMQLAADMPTVQFRLELLDWDYYGYDLDDDDNRTLTQNWKSLGEFFKNGYQLRKWLGDNNHFSPSRNWRVFPTCKGRVGQMDRFMTGDKLRTAQDWYDQGL